MTPPEVPAQRAELTPIVTAHCEHRPAWATRSTATLEHDGVEVVVAMSTCQVCGEPLLGVATPDGPEVVPTWYALAGLAPGGGDGEHRDAPGITGAAGRPGR